MNPEKLSVVGFSRNEALIYLALLRLGRAQAGTISKETQINRTTVYDALEQLLTRGVVSFVIEANKKVFYPNAPEKIIDSIKREEEEAKELIPELDKLFKDKTVAEESRIYSGRRGIKSVLQDILKHKEYVAFGASGKFLEIMQHDFKAFQKEKQKRGINSRIIISKKAKDSETVKTSFGTFGLLPDKYTSPTTTFIYGNYTAIIIWKETPIATVIKSSEVAKSFKNYFELLWKDAKKLGK